MLIQVLPIWEGTTNVLSLDVLRAIQKTDGEVINAFVSYCHNTLGDCGDSVPVRKLVSDLDKFASYMRSEFQYTSDRSARELAFTIANIYIGILSIILILLLFSFSFFADLLSSTNI